MALNYYSDNENMLKTMKRLVKIYERLRLCNKLAKGDKLFILRSHAETAFEKAEERVSHMKKTDYCFDFKIGMYSFQVYNINDSYLGMGIMTYCVSPGFNVYLRKDQRLYPLRYTNMIENLFSDFFIIYPHKDRPL